MADVASGILTEKQQKNRGPARLAWRFAVATVVIGAMGGFVFAAARMPAPSLWNALICRTPRARGACESGLAKGYLTVTFRDSVSVRNGKRFLTDVLERRYGITDFSNPDGSIFPVRSLTDESEFYRTASISLAPSGMQRYGLSGANFIGVDPMFASLIRRLSEQTDSVRAVRYDLGPYGNPDGSIIGVDFAESGIAEIFLERFPELAALPVNTNVIQVAFIDNGEASSTTNIFAYGAGRDLIAFAEYLRAKLTVHPTHAAIFYTDGSVRKTDLVLPDGVSRADVLRVLDELSTPQGFSVEAPPAIAATFHMPAGMSERKLKKALQKENAVESIKRTTQSCRQ